MFTPDEIRGVANEARETVKRSLVSWVYVSRDVFCVSCGIWDSFSVSMINPVLI